LIGVCSLEKVNSFYLDAHNSRTESSKALQNELDFLQEILLSFNLTPAQLRHIMRSEMKFGDYEHSGEMIHRSEACKIVFLKAKDLAISTGIISSLHLFAAILDEPGDVLIRTFEKINVRPASIMQKIIADLIKVKAFPNQELIQINPRKFDGKKDILHYLDKYGRDLTKEAEDGKLGPFFGRNKELLQIIQTLARHSKNNPVLVGPSGVGKTAIIEALAVRAAQGNDVQILDGKKIIELSMGTLIAGTKFRGEFEERITKIIEEAKNHPEVIIFIDEIHNVLGAGKAEGILDAANLLKTALSRGELHCIGATTVNEYRKYIESDPAFERRFDKIIVDEPSREETIDILKGIRPDLEKHHNTIITDYALVSAVDLSIRFDWDHKLPDKAIDLVDKASSQTRIPALSTKAVLVKDEELQGKRAAGDPGFEEVTEHSIARVLSEKNNIPVEIINGHLSGINESYLLEIESNLKKHIVGQDEAISRVCQRLLMAYTGLGKRHGPLAVFLFLGPTGVGKTELAKALSKLLFGSESSIIRLDMSEYMEEHSVAKLIGSPPGYLGYEEEGQLTGKLRTRPYAIVLLDEIDKAHPRVSDMFLQVFDEGRLTDSKGLTIDAKNAIFIMTSNIHINKKDFGFKQNNKETQKINLEDSVKVYFRNEFINRIDEFIVFKHLSKEDIGKILKPFLDEICINLEKQYDVSLKFTRDAEDFLKQACYSPQYGARELKRKLEELVQIPVSNLVLNGELKKHITWQVVHANGSVSIKPVELDVKG